MFRSPNDIVTCALQAVPAVSGAGQRRRNSPPIAAAPQPAPVAGQSPPSAHREPQVLNGICCAVAQKHLCQPNRSTTVSSRTAAATFSTSGDSKSGTIAQRRLSAYPVTVMLCDAGVDMPRFVGAPQRPQIAVSGGGRGAGNSTLRRMSQSPNPSRPVIAGGDGGGSRPPVIGGGRPAATPVAEDPSANPATLDYLASLRNAVRARAGHVKPLDILVGSCTRAEGDSSYRGIA